LLDIYGVDEGTSKPGDMVLEVFNISTNIRGLLRKDEQVMVFLRFLELIKTVTWQKQNCLLRPWLMYSKSANPKLISFCLYILS
jgi:hypothetical protein